jgi:hypothetical protein
MLSQKRRKQTEKKITLHRIAFGVDKLERNQLAREKGNKNKCGWK